jgi:hypothetical protein
MKSTSAGKINPEKHTSLTIQLKIVFFVCLLNGLARAD